MKALRLLDLLVLSRLGRCSRCMRQAMTAMLGAWLAFAAMALFVSGYWPTLALAGALAASALWLAHLVTFASPGMASADRNHLFFGRRAAIVRFSQAFAWAVVVTALPGNGRAQSACGCRLGDVCCNSKTQVTWECMEPRKGCTQWILQGKPCRQGQARCN
jgi:hypothetical protein